MQNLATRSVKVPATYFLLIRTPFGNQQIHFLHILEDQRAMQSFLIMQRHLATAGNQSRSSSLQQQQRKRNKNKKKIVAFLSYRKFLRQSRSRGPYFPVRSRFTASFRSEATCKTAQESDSLINGASLRDKAGGLLSASPCCSPEFPFSKSLRAALS